MDCSTCAYYTYDEEYEDYYCSVDMDEDDYGALLSREFKNCPYFRDGDEYKVVRHQL